MNSLNFITKNRQLLLTTVMAILTFGTMANPAITSYLPRNGPVGSMVTLTGSGFSTTQVGNIVYFGMVIVMIQY